MRLTAIALLIALALLGLTTSVGLEARNLEHEALVLPPPTPRTPRIWGPNVKANQDLSSYAQHEPSIAASPMHPSTVVVAAKDYRSGPDAKQVWIYVSWDGGETWPRQLQMPGLPADIAYQSDPVAVARDDGRLYVACMGYEEGRGLFLTWSDDDGWTWNDAVRITDERSPGWIDDKEWLALDTTLNSRYYHRMYVAYTPSVGNIYFTRSTDEGNTWSIPIPLARRASYMAYVVVAADGDVFVFYYRSFDPEQPGPLEVRRSTDGGLSFGRPVAVMAKVIQPGSPIRPDGPDMWRFFSAISAAADPTDPKRLYVAWTDPDNLDTDGLQVVLARTTDGGATWSPPQRLSHDPPGLVRDHITPVLATAPDGQLHALWLDRRDDPENRLFHAYYTSSTDGGASWEPDRRVSTVPFDLNVGLPPGSRNAAGDYWGLAAAGDVVYAAWTDTRDGQQDIYTARLAPSGILP